MHAQFLDFLHAALTFVHDNDMTNSGAIIVRETRISTPGDVYCYCTLLQRLRFSREFCLCRLRSDRQYSLLVPPPSPAPRPTTIKGPRTLPRSL